MVQSIYHDSKKCDKGMDKMSSTWYRLMLNLYDYKPTDSLDQVSYDAFLSLCYNELKDADETKFLSAAKHVFQYYMKLNPSKMFITKIF